MIVVYNKIIFFGVRGDFLGAFRAFFFFFVVIIFGVGYFCDYFFVVITPPPLLRHLLSPLPQPSLHHLRKLFFFSKFLLKMSYQANTFSSPLLASGRAFEQEGFRPGTGRISPSPVRNEVHSFARMEGSASAYAAAATYHPPSVVADPLTQSIGGSSFGSPLGNHRGASDALIVRLDNGGFVEVAYSPTALGIDIKVEIEEAEAIEAKRQRLFTAGNVEIDDYTDLQTAGVAPGGQLFMQIEASPRRFTATVQKQSALPPNVREIVIPRPNGVEPVQMSFDSQMCVSNLSPTGPAALAGVMRGMKILSANGSTVANTAEFKKQLTLGTDLKLLVLDPPKDYSKRVRNGDLFAVQEEETSEQRMLRSKQRDAKMREYEDRAERSRTIAWRAHRFFLFLMLIGSFGIGLAAAVVAGETDESACEKIDHWAISLACIMLISPLVIGFIWWQLHRRGMDIFDYTETLSIILLGFITLHVFALIVMSIIALIILTRDMTRAERDMCSQSRDLVVFVVVCSCVIFSVILCLTMVKYTHETNVDSKQKQIKSWRARTAGLPSNQPRDYQQDAENPKVPHNYI